MSRISASYARRSIALVSTLCALVVSAVAAAPLASAAAPDLAVVVPAETPAMTGSEGSDQMSGFTLVNVDATTRSGPATLQVTVTGSNLRSLEDGFGSCTPSSFAPSDPAATTTTGVCTYPNGLAAGRTLFVRMSLTLGVSGAVTATVVLPGDTNPANDTATIPVTVTQVPPAIVTLAVPPKPVRIGEPARLTVMLTDAAGQPLGGQLVTLMRKDLVAADFTRLTDVYTAATGVATLDTAAFDTATYKAVYAPPLPTMWGAAESAPALVRVIYVVTAAMSPVAVPPGSIAILTLRVRAGLIGTAVTVQQRIGKGPWKSIGHPRLLAGGRAQIRVTNLRQVASHTFRVIRGADATHDQGEGQTSIVVTTTGKGDPRSWVPLAGTTARPARWLTCAPIPYFVNPRRMPSSGLADLRESLRRVSIASGLTFRYAGRQDVLPTARNSGPDGAISFAWATPAESKGLLHTFTGGVTGTRTSGRRILGAGIIINAEAIRAGILPAGFGSGSSLGLVLMHETSHALGLGHVNDRWSIMQPSANLPAAVWGAGDLAGLRAVGRSSSCR